MSQTIEMFSKIELRKLIVPLIVEQFLAISVGIVDTIMVSSISEHAVSSLVLVDSINFLLINIFAALASGGVVVASQYLGKNDSESASDTCKQLIYATLLISVVLMILCLVFRFQMLATIFGKVDPKIMKYAQIYFMISAISYPFIALYNCGAAIFRAMGNSRISMKVSLFMNAINITGNAILIYGVGMGVTGAALSTLFSRCIGSIIILKLVQNPDLKIHVDSYRHFKFDIKKIRRILKIGIPSGLENGIFQAGRIVVQSLVATFGATSIAANAVASNFSAFMIIPSAAMGLAMISVVGRCAGAQDYVQAKKYIWKLMRYSYASVAVMSVLLYMFRVPLFQLYSLSGETIEIASDLIFICMIGNMLFWPMSFTFPSSLRACNDATYSMIVSISSMFIFRVGLSYTLVYFFNFKIEAIFIAMLMDWFARSVLFLLRYKSGRWKYRKLV